MTCGASWLYLRSAATAVRNPWEVLLSNLHIPLWSAAIPHLSVLSKIGAALVSFTMYSLAYLRSVLSCSQKKKIRKFAISGVNWSVIFWSVSDSSSSAFTKLDSIWTAPFGIARDASFWRLPRRRALLDPWCGVPKKSMANVQVYIECKCAILEAWRLAEYAKA